MSSRKKVFIFMVIQSVILSAAFLTSYWSHQNGFEKGYKTGYDAGYEKFVKNTKILEDMGICRYAELTCSKSAGK